MNSTEKIIIKLEILKDIYNCFDYHICPDFKLDSYFNSSKLEKIIEKYEYILEGINYNKN